jgi:uncharacterized membrane protein YqiK
MTLDAGVAIIFVLVVIVIALLALTLLFRASWRVAEPDEALIISGLRASGRPVGTGESMGFNIVTGRGALILPGLTKVRRLSLEAHESEITVPCVSQQKIQVDLRGIVVYKVGDDYQSIANAARRFLDRPATELETKVQNVFVGHLRAIAESPRFSGRINDRRGHDQRPGQVHPAGTGPLHSGDGVIRPGHRQFPDPGDHQPERLHRESRGAPPG